MGKITRIIEIAETYCPENADCYMDESDKIVWQKVRKLCQTDHPILAVFLQGMAWQQRKDQIV